jgi:chromosome segregation ATPase
MEKDLEHLRAEIDRLARETGELQTVRQNLEQQNQSMLTELDQGEKENTRLREEIGRSRAGLEQERSALEQMNTALAGMNQELESARASLLDLTAREAQYRNLYQNAANNRENLQRRLKRG